MIPFDTPEFERSFFYRGRLGSLWTPTQTIFRLWSPLAEAVILCLYPSGDTSPEEGRYPLRRGKQGVWETTLTGNLDGQYYTYEVRAGGMLRQTADPYAKGCGLNGGRSMVIDLERTNPPHWKEDTAPARPAENIIYEVHVKDFSADPASGIRPEYRGKFAGLHETGTTLNGAGIAATGLDYVKQLGVTHIELMPVYDYGSVDEAGEETQFNWGYDPVNYNVPEGSYSSDPRRGEVRIRELKEAIAALHKNGFRVIMDVVYNHTFSLDSWLNRATPQYYYRWNEDGIPSNGSGCGNDTASERGMCGQYILDSVLYWAEEYHMDGFRFDLMGLLPVELMNRIRAALDARYGVGEKLVFGEPWRAGKTALAASIPLADKENLRKLDAGVGAFCDATRDAIKGNLMEENARGFVNGGGFNQKTLLGCLRGWAGGEGEFCVKQPSQTICYLSSHDDWTLWDRLVRTVGDGTNFAAVTANLLAANRLAVGVLFGCQGNLFLLSGEEFGRTKQGIRDSYASPLAANQLDWKRSWENRELVAYYRGLFALRKQIPCLQSKTETAGDAVRTVRELCPDVAAVALTDTATHCRWKELLLLYNFGNSTQIIEWTDEGWQLLVSARDSFVWQNPTLVRRAISIPPVSALILGR